MTNDNILVYYWNAALSRWKLLAGIILGITLLGWAYSALILTQNPKYEAFARINVVPTSEELGYATRFARGQNAEGTLVLLQTYAEYARSRDVRETVVDRWITTQAAKAGTSRERWLESQHQEPSLLSPGNILSWINYGKVASLPLREELVEELGEATTIESIEGTFLMQIAVEWDTPTDAAWFANGLTAEVMAQVQGQSEASGESLSEVLRGELATKKAQLAQLKEQSRRRKIALGVVDVDRQKQALLDEQIAEQSRLTSDMAEARRVSAQVSALKAQANGKLSPTQTSIEEQLALEQPRAAAARQSISTRQSRISAISSQLKKLANAELSLKTLDDDIAVLQDEVAELTQRLQFSETENLTNRPQIRLLDEAQVPVLRSSPKILVNTALSFIAGCALAAMALLLLGPKPAYAEAQERDDPASDDGHAAVVPAAAAPLNATANDLPEPQAREVAAPVQPVIRREMADLPEQEEAAMPRFMKRADALGPRGVVSAAAPALQTFDERHEDNELASASDETERNEPELQSITGESDHRHNVVPIGAEAIERADEVVAALAASTCRERQDQDGAGQDISEVSEDLPAEEHFSDGADPSRSDMAEDELELGATRLCCLPRPEEGAYYSPQQVAALSSRVLHWLWLAIVADGTLDIFGTTNADEANGMAKLVLDSLHAEGISVRALRAGSPAHTAALRKSDGSFKLLVHRELAGDLSGAASANGPVLIVAADDSAAGGDAIEALTNRFAGEDPYVAIRDGV